MSGKARAWDPAVTAQPLREIHQKAKTMPRMCLCPGSDRKRRKLELHRSSLPRGFMSRQWTVSVTAFVSLPFDEVTA